MSRIAYPQMKNSISVAERTNDVDSNLTKNQIKSDDYETISNDLIHQNNSQSNCTSSDVELIKNLIDPSFDDTESTINKMTLINNERQASNRQLQYSLSSDLHHLYPNSASNDAQFINKLDELRKENEKLVNQVSFYRNEKEKLVKKSKEQLSIKRDEKSKEDQLNSMKAQLALQDDTINDLMREAKLWKSKFGELSEKHHKTISRIDEEQIKLEAKNKSLQKKNDELEVDLVKCSEEKRELEAENKQLHNKLFHSTAELEQMKKSTDSCELLRKDRLRSQQKSHVIAEKLEECKAKLEQSTNLLKEKSCLVDQQKKEIKDLNGTINDLKKANSFNQIEIEKNKNLNEHLQSKLKEKEELVNEYKSLYHEIKSSRENEIKHEQQTIKSLVTINSKYETELSTMRADLEKLRYDQMMNAKMRPDLIEDNSEYDHLSKLKKKYNILNNDDEQDDVYEPAETGVNEYRVNGDQLHNGFAKKLNSSSSKFHVQNGNSVNSTSITSTDLNGTIECTHISETVLPS